MDTFIDIVGQNWFGIARLGTPLQQTAVQRGPLLRWPQLSRLAWARENVSVFQVINRRCPATLFKAIFYGYRIWGISELDLGIWGPQIQYAYFMG